MYPCLSTHIRLPPLPLDFHLPQVPFCHHHHYRPPRHRLWLHLSSHHHLLLSQVTLSLRFTFASSTFRLSWAHWGEACLAPPSIFDDIDCSFNFDACNLCQRTCLVGDCCVHALIVVDKGGIHLCHKQVCHVCVAVGWQPSRWSWATKEVCEADLGLEHISY